MYSQVANVAKLAADADRGVQLSADMQQKGLIQESTQEAQKVRQLREQEALRPLLEDGSGGGAPYNGSQRKKQDKKTQTIKEEVSRLKEDYLGNKLDITG